MANLDNLTPVSPQQSQSGELNWQQTKVDQRNIRIQRAREICGNDNVVEIISSTEQLETTFLELAALSSEFGKTPGEIAQLMREFSHAFYSRVFSENLTHNDVIKAMNTATSIMRPEERNDEISDNAREMATKILDK